MLFCNVGRIEARSHSPPQNARSHSLPQNTRSHSLSQFCSIPVAVQS
ncbi:MAG: hypothetical protein RID09_10085 [Coleofasciculus sp. G1-WW12-02]